MHGVETIAFRSAGLELYGRYRHRRDGAPTAVLLCGLGFHTFEYEPLATRLAVAGVNSLSFDYRGHGRSPGPRGRWTLDELAADCGHALDFLSRRDRGPVVLFGNSLGAMVAILCAAHDERTLGVVAANCLARADDFLLTRPRRGLFALLKLIEPVRPAARQRQPLHPLRAPDRRPRVARDDPARCPDPRREAVLRAHVP
jgi:alpha-beta hydrolase superfamily lysophospholipase